MYRHRETYHLQPAEIEHLREAARVLSSRTVARIFGVSRATVWKHTQGLPHPRRRVRLKNVQEALMLARL